ARFLPDHEAYRPGLVQAARERIELQFDVAPENYIHRHRLSIEPLCGDDSFRHTRLPDGMATHDECFGDSEVYHTTLRVMLDITPGNSPARQLRVEYQGCADAGLCYPPEIHTLDLPGAGGAPGVAGSSDDDRSLGWSLLLLFAAGLALTFSPCVLPMVPIL